MITIRLCGGLLSNPHEIFIEVSIRKSLRF